ncbi:helix-turn-helix domain-containing protein [Vulgatibacter sp.]|uniref:helix-turn-helix domain-containing protein n=1 Tax=Vulgatibacter sp. TaxID=1971226 RepID=UPI0035625942
MRALLRADRADDELARALARAGLYVERLAEGEAAARLARGDVAVVDPRLLAAAAPASLPPAQRATRKSLEALCYEKLADLLERLGEQRLPALYDTVLAQMERALLRLSLERTTAVSAAADYLGIHRNTLARRLEALGLRERVARTRPAATAGKRR